MNESRFSRFYPVSRALLGKSQWREFFGLAFLAVGYWFVLQVGLMIDHTTQIAVIWPAGGVALGALLITPKRYWAGILSFVFVINTLGNLHNNNPFWVSVFFSLIHAASAFLCALTIIYFCGTKVTFEQASEVLALLLSAIFCNGLIAVVGALIHVIAFQSSFINTWMLWWAANGLGIILIAPAMLSWHVASQTPPSYKQRLPEMILFAVVLVIFATLLFGPATSAERPILRNYMLFPFLIWLAFRFNMRDVVSALFVFSVIAIWHTMNGHGIFGFANQPRTENLIALQIYLSVASFSGLLLSAMVSERRRAEKILNDSRAQLAKAQLLSHVGHWTWIVSTDTIEWSDEIYRILGFEPQSIEPSMGVFQAAVHPDDLDDYMMRRTTILGEKRESVAEYRLLLSNGSIHYVEERIHKEEDPSGESQRIIGTVQDITARKETEKALRDSQNLLSTFLSHSPIHAYIKCVTPTESRVLYASHNFEQMIGVPGEEMVGKTMEQLFPAEFAAKITADDWDVISTNKVLKMDEELNGRVYTTIKFPILQDGKTMLAGYTIDITDRKDIEEALRKSEEKYRLVANFTYDWEAWHAPNGRYLYVSPSCERITGYTAQEFLTDPELIIKITHPDDHANIITHFHATADEAHQRDVVFDFRIITRSGETRWLNHSCIAVYSDDGKWIGRRESNRDVTSRKQSEAALRARLQLGQFADNHTVDEVLEYTLNEVEALTESQIGFFHSLAPDQKTLTLQAWSTNTLNNMCKAEGRGLHYSIDEAGVWVDCVRKREPVIYNDYASLPHRKGLPEGHAPVKSILVAPIMRNDLIVAIIGVGNKTTAYDYQDIKMVSQLAELVWDVVLRKKSEEEVRQTKNDLEIANHELKVALEREKKLSHTDSLTGIHNRRYLFELAEREFDIAKRHSLPLSIIMFDIDYFKKINDTFGHDIGDLVLQRVVESAHAELRSADIIGRYGGEEFVIILPMTNAQQAHPVAERIRANIEALRVPTHKQEASVTLSIGIVDMPHQLRENASVDDLVRHADEALYTAKQAGRNRISIYKWQ